MKFDANAIFENELRRRGLVFTRADADGYRIRTAELEVSASLVNVRRNAERDGDPGVITRFVDHVLATAIADTRTWEEASRSLFLAAECADQDFRASIWLRVSDEVARVLTLTDDAQTRITWITPKTCERWGVSVEQATAAALSNQDRLLDGISLEFHEDDVEHELGMVPLDSPYKASVIFAPAFKTFVQPSLGWPVSVVIPCRDFIYVVADRSPLIGTLGSVVVKEFRSSGYPITAEVLRVSDEGITALGRFSTDSADD